MIIVNRRRSFLLYVLLILLLTTDCHKNSTGSSINGISIRALDHSITITNNNIFSIRFLVVESKTALLIDWYPSCETNDQNKIQALESIEIMHEDIHGYFENCEIIVYWWFCIRKSGEDDFVYDEIRFEVVRTK